MPGPEYSEDTQDLSLGTTDFPPNVKIPLESPADPKDRHQEFLEDGWRDEKSFGQQIADMGSNGSDYPFTVLDPQAARIIKGGVSLPPVRHHETKPKRNGF